MILCATRSFAECKMQTKNCAPQKRPNVCSGRRGASSGFLLRRSARRMRTARWRAAHASGATWRHWPELEQSRIDFPSRRRPPPSGFIIRLGSPPHSKRPAKQQKVAVAKKRQTSWKVCAKRQSRAQTRRATSVCRRRQRNNSSSSSGSCSRDKKQLARRATKVRCYFKWSVGNDKQIRATAARLGGSKRVPPLRRPIARNSVAARLC